jgi:hypothetical protein
MRPSCTQPVPFGTLVAYWFGELGEEAEQRVEEHVLGCSHCSCELAWLAQLGDGVRLAFWRGHVRAVISAPFLESMKEHGMRFREYPVSPGGRVDCTIGAADDAVVGRLKAPLSGIARIDLVCRNEKDDVRFRLRDIPVDPPTGEVLFCPAAATLKRMRAHTDRIQLLAVEADGDRPIADYTFVHTPG